MLSPRGPQFFSVFWREFCSLIGARESLSTPRPMVRLKGRMKRWRQPSAAWFHRIIHPGRGASFGWSMCIIPSPTPPLASPRFSVFMGTNHQSSPPWLRKCPARLLCLFPAGAGGTGFELEPPFRVGRQEPSIWGGGFCNLYTPVAHPLKSVPALLSSNLAVTLCHMQAFPALISGLIPRC